MDPVTTPYILIVEDSKTQARMLQFLLEGHNYTVRLAEHGQAAIENIQAQPILPWLVLSDIFMPVMNGFDLCKRLRAHPDWHTIRIALMTSTHGPAEIVPVMECGADAFLTKPIQETHLLQTIAPWNPNLFASPQRPPDPDLENPISFQIQAGDSLRPVHTTGRNLKNALTSYYCETALLNRKSVNLEREAAEKRIWFESLLNALPDPAFIVTAQDEILAANPQFFLLLKRPDNAPLTGQTCRETLPQNFLERIENLKATAAQTGRSTEDTQAITLSPLPQPWRLFLAPLTDRVARTIGHLILLRPLRSQYNHPGAFEPAEALPCPTQTETKPPHSDGILDIEDGLNRLGGNAAIYQKVLKVFYSENLNTHEKVLAALRSGDRETLHRLVHTVKGASGNIGARELYALAAQTEETIRSGTHAVEEPIHMFLKSLDRLLDTLANEEKLSLK